MRRLRLSAPLIGAAALLCLAAVGCKPNLLPGTNIEDTPENRAVIDFVEKYRSAVESRSAQQVLSLVASDYWEDNGTVEQADDYGVEKLQRELDDLFGRTRTIHLQVQVQNIERDDAGVVRVDYRYLQRALLALEAGEKWVSHADVNRIVLRPRGEAPDDGYEIISGL